jgi:hypothetical protein
MAEITGATHGEATGNCCPALRATVNASATAARVPPMTSPAPRSNALALMCAVGLEVAGPA